MSIPDIYIEKYECEYCEFVGETKETMELHIGKTHTDTFERENYSLEIVRHWTHA